MPRNVEIKAKLPDFDETKRLAELLTNSQPDILIQEDTFYNVPSGRFKLRKFQGGQTAQLVFYNRPDQEGPKLSEFSITPVDNPEQLGQVLEAALGVKGVVKKTRYLYFSGQTRIHLDQVLNLGGFLELEVCLNLDQTVEEGQQIAEDLMQKLGINQKDLLTGAYLDLQ